MTRRMYLPTSGKYDAPRHRLKNPFTMSKICGQIPRNRPKPELFRFISGVSWKSHLQKGGGAYRDRTDDLMLAKQPLSQLS
jgi:hypothetical protein